MQAITVLVQVLSLILLMELWGIFAQPVTIAHRDPQLRYLVMVDHTNLELAQPHVKLVQKAITAHQEHLKRLNAMMAIAQKVLLRQNYVLMDFSQTQQC